MVPSFRELFPPRFERYFEPFLGGGAVFLALGPERALLSDLNAELIHCWRVVRDAPVALMESLDRHIYEREHYYRVRALRPDDLAEVERASRFIYLNKCCYNGLYRVNREGRFNVPFGRQARPPRLYDRPNLLRVSRLLRGARLRRAPFEEAVEGARAGDFVYFDPPYQPLSKTAHFTAYTAGCFGAEDQRRLAALARELDRRGCLLALSNSDTPGVRGLYRGFRLERLCAARAINSRAEGRGRVAEILVRNC